MDLTNDRGEIGQIKNIYFYPSELKVRGFWKGWWWWWWWSWSWKRRISGLKVGVSWVLWKLGVGCRGSWLANCGCHGS